MDEIGFLSAKMITSDKSMFFCVFLHKIHHLSHFCTNKAKKVHFFSKKGQKDHKIPSKSTKMCKNK